MSHQSGIQVSEDLQNVFSRALTSDETRALIIIITAESLHLFKEVCVEGSWEEDFSNLENQVPENSPCYILYRLDTKSKTENWNWIFISFVPDHSKVREKMIYASTRATLIKELETDCITDQIHLNHKTELCLKTYLEHVNHKNADHPLTEKEQNLAYAKKMEKIDDISISTRKAPITGFSFSLTEDTWELIDKLVSENDQKALILRIEDEKEVIKVDPQEFVDLNDLSTNISSTSPQYILAKHSNQETRSLNYYLILLSPDSSSVKRRMLYSSCYHGLISQLIDKHSIELKNFTIHDISDLNDKLLKNSNDRSDRFANQSPQPKFSKPAPRAGRSALHLKKRPSPK